MYRKTIIVLLTGASSLTAANPAVDAIDAILRARQATDTPVPTTTLTTVSSTVTTDACWSSLDSIESSLPTPPPVYVSWQASREVDRLQTMTEPITPLFDSPDEISSVCSSQFNKPPGSTPTTTLEPPPASVLAPEAWNSYQSSIVSWVSAYRPIVSEAAAACSRSYPKELGPMLLPFVDSEDACRTAFSLRFGLVPATATETGTTAINSLPVSTAGAARETGYIVAVAAAAVGVAGAMGAM